MYVYYTRDACNSTSTYPDSPEQILASWLIGFLKTDDVIPLNRLYLVDDQLVHIRTHDRKWRPSIDHSTLNKRRLSTTQTHVNDQSFLKPNVKFKIVLP